jgi:hypothetical protein
MAKSFAFDQTVDEGRVAKRRMLAQAFRLLE